MNKTFQKKKIYFFEGTFKVTVFSSSERKEAIQKEIQIPRF